MLEEARKVLGVLRCPVLTDEFDSDEAQLGPEGRRVDGIVANRRQLGKVAIGNDLHPTKRFVDEKKFPKGGVEHGKVGGGPLADFLENKPRGLAGGLRSDHLLRTELFCREAAPRAVSQEHGKGS